jgi:hypothetical protein
MITVILNGFRRPQNLTLQMEALEKQTVKPTEVLVWYNHPGDEPVNRDIIERYDTCYSRKNFGVWSRFFLGFNASNPYVCVFDDDTIPGSKWLENCLNTMEKREGLLGTNGMRWIDTNKSYYDSRFDRVGWHSQNKEIEEVDIVGHSWFFKREWLSYFTRELHDPVENKLHGEDMHFSYMLQKYANIPTLVPPHPIDDIEMWGSTRGIELGCTPQAVARTPNINEKFNNYFTKQRRAGWKLVEEH